MGWVSSKRRPGWAPTWLGAAAVSISRTLAAPACHAGPGAVALHCLLENLTCKSHAAHRAVCQRTCKGTQSLHDRASFGTCCVDFSPKRPHHVEAALVLPNLDRVCRECSSWASVRLRGALAKPSRTARPPVCSAKCWKAALNLGT